MVHFRDQTLLFVVSLPSLQVELSHIVLEFRFVIDHVLQLKASQVD